MNEDEARANGFIRGAALEWGKQGILANALCPTHGKSSNLAMPPEADALGKSYEEIAVWDPHKRAIPLELNRPPALRDNAHLALVLASDESAYMSGHCIQSADGGSSGVLPPELQQQVH